MNYQPTLVIRTVFFAKTIAPDGCDPSLLLYPFYPRLYLEPSHLPLGQSLCFIMLLVQIGLSRSFFNASSLTTFFRQVQLSILYTFRIYHGKLDSDLRNLYTVPFSSLSPITISSILFITSSAVSQPSTRSPTASSSTMSPMISSRPFSTP